MRLGYLLMHLIPSNLNALTPNFSIVYQPRLTGKGGGVAFIIRLNYVQRLLILQRSYKSAFEIRDVDDYNISETITTTDTSFVLIGSVTCALPYSENGNLISLTVSEILPGST